MRIATRSSPLALWQARHVAEQLQSRFPGIAFEIIPMRTSGDRLLQAPLANVGGKGLFLKELESALLNGHADIAVHSMKDVPVQLPPGLHIPVVLARADPRDALIATAYDSIDHLPVAARVGTSSLRRKSQLLGLRPDLHLVDLRGGIHTRLKRLRKGDFDAIVLAASGLQRLGYFDCITQILDTKHMLPAVGQGILGIECRCDDTEVESLIDGLRDATADRCIRAERTLSAMLMGGCQAPIAAFAQPQGNALRLQALVTSLDGQQRLFAEHISNAAPEALGRVVANKLKCQGAEQLLQAAYAYGQQPG